ncbi:hypothetical protein EXIGLDRAFT_781386 [Exidia glandulosa HHB12029]|uniref:Uncharacterized protein n=1 Tax=Exidia glandulosa HHB12029 TaxID=1314781 RepID=A0A165Z7K0_EXIGL|nr:hypothetical protein EXIGLDRAFT_781386 [Exidia glandulosa HHB12029]
MAEFSAQQRAALAAAHAQLRDVGLSHLLDTTVLSTSAHTTPLTTSVPTAHTVQPSLPSSDSDPPPNLAVLYPHPAILATRHRPPPATVLSAYDIALGLNKITRESSAYALILHLPNHIVEFPQSGSSANERIAHIFSVDPDAIYHPKDDFQYSFDKGHGAKENKICQLLRDGTGTPVLCR